MSTPLTAVDLQRYRRRLLEQLARHTADSAALVRDSLEPSGGERFQDVDESIEETCLADELGLLAAEDELCTQLRDALERLQQGVYGRCEGCGGWIARQRLDSVPHARLCAPCARAE